LVRFERRDDVHQGLLHLGCALIALICWRLLTRDQDVHPELC
jgi:hypothetical protein